MPFINSLFLTGPCEIFIEWEECFAVANSDQIWHFNQLKQFLVLHLNLIAVVNVIRFSFLKMYYAARLLRNFCCSPWMWWRTAATDVTGATGLLLKLLRSVHRRCVCSCFIFDASISDPFRLATAKIGKLSEHKFKNGIVRVHQWYLVESPACVCQAFFLLINANWSLYKKGCAWLLKQWICVIRLISLTSP